MSVIADERRSSLRYGMKEIVTSVDADLYEVGDYKQPAIDDHRSLLPAEILGQYKSMTREVRKRNTSEISPLASYAISYSFQVLHSLPSIFIHFRCQFPPERSGNSDIFFTPRAKTKILHPCCFYCLTNSVSPKEVHRAVSRCIVFGSNQICVFKSHPDVLFLDLIHMYSRTVLCDLCHEQPWIVPN